MNLRSTVVLLPLLAAAACSEPLEFADWTIPVPEGTRIVEYVHVRLADRTERIELVEDLVISEGQEPFYRLIDVDVDEHGNIYAFDWGNRNIVAFDANGNYLRTFGRSGQGPGEIGTGGRIAIVGTELVHVSSNRLNVWAPDGEVVESRNMAFTRFLLPIAGTEVGFLLGSYNQRDEQGDPHRHVVGVSPAGELELEYVKLPDPGSVSLRRRSGAIEMGTNTMIPRPAPTFAASRQGEIYAVAGDEYQMLAFAPDGTVRWALRTTLRRPVLSYDRIDEALRHLAERSGPGDQPMIPPPRRSEVDWPDELPALVGSLTAHRYTEPIRVDGHGHVYVFPFISDAWDKPDQPVDVYSADGVRLFSGMLPIARWDTALGDFVYAVGTDLETEEYHVVRYRLVEPFE